MARQESGGCLAAAVEACDYATGAFKEMISSIENEHEKVKERITVQNEDGEEV